MKIIGYTLILITVFNFVSYGIIETIIGGSAIYGKIERGRYYVGGNKRNGPHYIEVSRSVYEYSLFHTQWFMVPLPLGLVGIYLLIRNKKERPNHAA